jgi:hypothetical protein
VGSVWRDMITGNGGFDTKCQSRRRSTSAGSEMNSKNTMNTKRE